ncbi:MAG: AAA family ATPase [Bacteroidetes bacterium]|nr:AAA family ATPase [Bacteroidota bacterium]
MMFQKAIKAKQKLRLALEGASGSGKTFSSLLLAKAMGERIAVIDTEHGSASLYADRFEFDVLDLKPPYEPERFIEAIEMAEKAGYGVIIIDSISHEWNGEGGCLQIVDKIGGNSYTAWGKVTPRHDRFINAMLKSKAHIIATMRSKANYETGKDEKTGKMTIEKKGTAPIQRDSVDYEFTVVFDLNQRHLASVSKDRTSLFDGKDFLITEDIGHQLLRWLNDGTEPIQQPAKPEPQKPTPPPVQSNVLPKQLASEDQLTRIGDLLREEDFLTIETVNTTRDYLKKHPQPTAEAAIRIIRKLEEEIGKNRETVPDGQPDEKESFESLFGGAQ